MRLQDWLAEMLAGQEIVFPLCCDHPSQLHHPLATCKPLTDVSVPKNDPVKCDQNSGLASIFYAGWHAAVLDADATQLTSGSLAARELWINQTSAANPELMHVVHLAFPQILLGLPSAGL